MDDDGDDDGDDEVVATSLVAGLATSFEAGLATSAAVLPSVELRLSVR